MFKQKIRMTIDFNCKFFSFRLILWQVNWQQKSRDIFSQTASNETFQRKGYPSFPNNKSWTNKCW